MNIQHMTPGGDRLDVLHTKHRYGIVYGAVLGLGFSAFTWGMDAVILSNYHALYPFLKVSVGAVLCAILGGVTGWISAKLNKPLYSAFIWLVAASIFAWLSVNMTVLVAPKLLSIIEPQTAGLINYVYYEGFNSRVGVGYAWIALFTGIAGLLQIPLSDSAVFSTSVFSKVGPLLITVILMAICGWIVDNGVLNEPLRSSIVAMDNTIRFVVEHRGQEVDKMEARRMFATSLRIIDASVTDQRELIVSEYDELLEEVIVLVKFEKDWAECKVIYNQPISCKAVEVSP